MTTPTSTPTSRKRRGPKHARCRPETADTSSGQLLATDFLVRGCERALFDLRCSLGEAATSRDVRVGLAAAELLEQVLGGWRETLRALRTQDAGTFTPR